MAKIHHSSVTSQMSRHFDTSPQQLKDKPKKSIQYIMLKRLRNSCAPLQTEQMPPPASQTYGGFLFFLIKKKNIRGLLYC